MYCSIILLIACIAYHKTNAHSDYILGSRRFNGWVTAMSVGATNMSGWLMLGLPGAVYAAGLSQWWLPLGLFIGAPLNWWLIAPRLRVYTQMANNALTIPTFLEHRFADSSHLLRGVSALCMIFFFFIYIISGFVAAGHLLSHYFAISYQQALWWAVGMTVLYTCIGGFLAISWIDLFQSLLIVLALVLIPWLVNQQISSEHHLSLLNIIYSNISEHALFSAGFWGAISLMAWGLGYVGQPHILVRFMAAKNLTAIRQGAWLCVSWMMICYTAAFATGLMGAYYFIADPLHNPETVLMQLTLQLATPVLAGLVLSAILSAIMSTLAAQLLAASSALCEDTYRLWRKKPLSEQKLITTTRLLIVAIALIACWFARDPNTQIMHLVGFAWAGLGAALGPVVICALYRARTSAQAALAGVIGGALTVLCWPLLTLYIPYLGQIYAIIPGFLISFACIYAVDFYRLTSAKNRHHCPLQQQHQQFILEFQQAKHSSSVEPAS